MIYVPHSLLEVKGSWAVAIACGSYGGCTQRDLLHPVSWGPLREQEGAMLS